MDGRPNLPPDLRNELLLQINENLMAAGIITREVYEIAKQKIVART